ncbi:MAG: hypothetical protein ACREOF_00690 [Gemmatimonadales bacterium]
MAGQGSGGRRAVLYWVGWAILLVAVTAVVWAVFQRPADLGI